MPTTDIDRDLTRVRDLAECGETQLATIVAIRALAGQACDPRPELLNDLAVLRHEAGDLRGALACVRAALEVDPRHALARANLEALLASDGVSEASVDAGTPTGSATLNPWVRDALETANSMVGLRGRRVLEVGGSVPAAAVRALGVAHWTACDLRPGQEDAPDYSTLTADAGALPIESACMQAAWSVCAFEHFAQPERVLSEVHRVLEPGARFFTQFAPIWSCAVGHHLWIMEDGRQLATFNDPVIPRWGHLLLERHELRGYLELTLGPALATRVDRCVWRSTYINRLSDGDFQRLLAASSFEVVRYGYWGGRTQPQAALREELARRHPDLGDPAAHGLRWLLQA